VKINSTALSPFAKFPPAAAAETAQYFLPTTYFAEGEPISATSTTMLSQLT
jgi:hypothetical protein